MTTNTTETKKLFGILGIGAAACAACCAGPILGFVAATGLLTAGGLAAFGAIGLLVAIPVSHSSSDGADSRPPAHPPTNLARATSRSRCRR